MDVSLNLLWITLLVILVACNKPEGLDVDVYPPDYADNFTLESVGNTRIRFYKSLQSDIGALEDGLQALEEKIASAGGDKKGDMFTMIGFFRGELSAFKSQLYVYGNDVNAGADDKKQVEESWRNIQQSYNNLFSQLADIMG